MTTPSAGPVAPADERAAGATAARPRASVYEQVTEQLVAFLEAGTAPWRQPWDARVGVPLSLSTSRPYRGLNAVVLGMLGSLRGYESPWWGTYRRIAELGGQVRRGEHATLVTFWKVGGRRGEDRTGDDGAAAIATAEAPGRRYFVLRHYHVFNPNKCSGLDVAAPGRPEGFDPVASCEAIAAGYLGAGRPGPALEHRGDRAGYSALTDRIVMPPPEAFDAPADYYVTLFHEAVHSTGHRSRLARPPGLAVSVDFGAESYAREELVAEMGAAMLAGVAGIERPVLPASAAYLAGWIGALRGDPRMAVAAAGAAQRAADFVLGTSEEQPARDEERAAPRTAVAAGRMGP